MANPDPRCFPLIEVELDQMQSLLYPVLKGAAITGVELVEGGLTNTLYRITPADGGRGYTTHLDDSCAARLLSIHNYLLVVEGESIVFMGRWIATDSFQVG